MTDGTFRRSSVDDELAGQLVTSLLLAEEKLLQVGGYPYLYLLIRALFITI